MLAYSSVLAILVCLLLPIFNNAEVIVTVILNGSFRIQMFPKTLDNQSNCTLTNPQDEVTIIPFDYGGGAPQKVVPMGNNQCGAIVHDTIRTDVGRWILALSNTDGESITEIFRVRTVPAITYTNTTSAAVIGDMSVIISCGPTSMMYCELKNPLGNAVSLTGRDRCQTVIETVRPTDFGVWTCTVGVSGSTEEISATHTLQIGDPAEEVVIFSNDTSLGNIINWQVNSVIPAASWCRAFTPKGQSILILPGLGTEKYVSAGTDLTKNKCGLLINTEFSEEYVGIWRLEMGLTSGRILGGFIRMPEGELPGPNDPDTGAESGSSLITQVNVAVGESFSISCQTQYPAGYCWIKGPRGQMYTSTNELTVGRCSQTNILAISDDHNGLWTCNMAHINGGREDHFVTRVNVIDKLFRAVSTETTVHRGHKALIACRAVLETPLQYCRFIRPDGVGLGIAPEMGPSGRYSYQGPGLGHGYCGLAISSVEKVDIGKWTCVSRASFRTWDAENWDTTMLLTPETSVASVVGLTLGAFFLLVIIVGVLIVRKMRRRSKNTEESMIVEYSRN